MKYDVLIEYDVEDDYNGETITTHVREDKVFNSRAEVIKYRDSLHECPWISNVTIIDKTVVSILNARIGR